MIALHADGEVDELLVGDILCHLSEQLGSVRNLLALVLEQGSAIRAREVQRVVMLTGRLQAELQRREGLERDRTVLLNRAGERLGIPGGEVTLQRLEPLMDTDSAAVARLRSLELQGLLAELRREHACNRALMQQELAFLDHLLALTGDRPEIYTAGGERPGVTPTLIAARRRVLDLEA